MADSQNDENKDMARATGEAHNLSKINQTETHKSPEKLLGSILKGKIDEIDDFHHPFVINGHKINNKVLRVYILQLKQNLGWSDTKILEMLILLDEVVEKGVVDNDFLEQVKDNPDLLNIKEE